MVSSGSVMVRELGLILRWVCWEYIWYMYICRLATIDLLHDVWLVVVSKVCSDWSVELTLGLDRTACVCYDYERLWFVSVYMLHCVSVLWTRADLFAAIPSHCVALSMSVHKVFNLSWMGNCSTDFDEIWQVEPL